jgi:DHA3 family macrolide efflux protein-like MFS transporter
MSELASTDKKIAGGMWAFAAMWAGQVVSMMGSDLTGFALGVWVYQHTGSVTQFSLIILCAELPGIVLSPVVGAVVDRSDRRRLMILSNIGAGLSTLVVALLTARGWLRLWHICILTALISTCASFLRPAFSASISLLVPKRHLGRANGMVQTGQAAAQIVSPLLAGFLVITIGIQGVVTIDFATYLVAVVALLLVRVPSPEASAEGAAGGGSVLRAAAYGWRYIMGRPGIFALLVFFAVTNFTVTMSNILVTPLVLSFADAAVYGSVLAVTGAGVLAGGLVMSLWGGPKHRIYGVFFYGVVQGAALVGQGLRPSAVLIAASLFCAAFSAPVVSGCFVPILQSKTPPDVQGRVFAAVRLVSWCSVPVAYLLAGPLTDKVFGPLLAPGGQLAGSVGLVVGTGPGRGIGLLLIVMGAITLLATLRAYLYPRLRNIEAEMPDKLPEVVAVAEG